MNNSLYVDPEGLEENVRELDNWLKQFNELHNQINGKIDDLNTVWKGADYDAMKASIQTELNNIIGENGLIQSFVRECIDDVNNKKGEYVAIQNSNTNYWA